MEKKDIKKKLIKLLVEVAELEEGEEIIGENNLFETYGINSIVALQYLVSVEEMFDIEIDDEYLDGRLINDMDYLSEYILEKVEKTNG